jgi:membrane protease YdiL (CAAX protease family)
MNNNSAQPLASGRHLAGFFLILAGIATASWLMARYPFSHRFLIYLALIAMELLRVWYVIAGARANGNGFMSIVGRGWSTWRDGARDSLLAIATIVLVAVTARALVFLLGSWSPDTAFMLPTNFAESAGWIVLSITGGICEEIAYRGYLQRQLWVFTGSLPIAVCLQAVAFGAVHLYQGWKPVVVIVGIGLVLGSVAAWRRSIIPGTIAHSILDILGGLLGG